VVDETDPGAESDLRRRALWLLGMLAVVAVLLVIVISAVTGGGGNDKNTNVTGPLDSEATTSAPRTPSTHSSASKPRSRTSSKSSSSAIGHGSCPTQQPCILAGDVGDGIGAINDYRTQHGRSSVPGTVTTQAQKCAIQRGNGCTGGWAWTEISEPDGQAAVQNMLAFGRFLDSDLTSIEVGWAYNPSAKLYYFASIRND